MTARVRHLRTKFVDDAADPAQLIARGIRKSMGFWYFSVKRRFFLHHQMASHRFTLLVHFLAQFYSCGEASSC